MPPDLKRGWTAYGMALIHRLTVRLRNKTIERLLRSFAPKVRSMRLRAHGSLVDWVVDAATRARLAPSWIKTP